MQHNYMPSKPTSIQHTVKVAHSYHSKNISLL